MHLEDITHADLQEMNVLKQSFKIATDPKVNGYQRGLAAMVYKFFNERTKGSGVIFVKNCLNNLQLAEELHKPISVFFI